jgi:hypothetical protein
LTLSGHGDARSKADKDNPFIEIPEPNLPASLGLFIRGRRLIFLAQAQAEAPAV